MPLSFVFICARCALSVCRYVCVSVRTFSPELWQLQKPNAVMLTSTTETGVLFPRVKHFPGGKRFLGVCVN